MQQHLVWNHFEFKKDCLVLSGDTFDLLARRTIIYRNEIKNVTLRFDNICNIALTNPILILDGSEIRLPTIPATGFETKVNFDRFGSHNATITYTEGISRIEFGLESPLFRDYTLLISISIIITFIIFGAKYRRAVSDLIEKYLERVPEEKRVDLKMQRFMDEVRNKSIKKIRERFKEEG